MRKRKTWGTAARRSPHNVWGKKRHKPSSLIPRGRFPNARREKILSWSQDVPLYTGNRQVLPPQQTWCFPCGYEKLICSSIYRWPAKTEQYRQTFLPRMVKTWNTLDRSTKLLQCPDKLARCVVPKPKINPLYLVTLTRRSQVLLSRLRMGNHDLKGNLGKIVLADDTSCDCCCDEETAVHHWEQCSLYDHIQGEITKTIPLECWTNRVNIWTTYARTSKGQHKNSSYWVNALSKYVIRPANN